MLHGYGFDERPFSYHDSTGGVRKWSEITVSDLARIMRTILHQLRKRGEVWGNGRSPNKKNLLRLPINTFYQHFSLP